VAQDLDTDKVSISIVVPVYNSEGNVEALQDAVAHELAGVSYELIFVDDRSRDGSWAVIKDLAQKHPEVIGISLRKNYGQDNAIMVGLRHARGQAVVIMDDDLQHHPRDIKRLCAELDRGYDVCFANFTNREHSIHKRLISDWNGRVAELVISKPRGIYLSPYKAIRKEVVDEITKYDGPYPYVDGLLFQYTANVTQIDAQHHKRHSGRSSTTFWRQFMLFLSFVTNFSILPLRIAALSGVIVSVIALILGLFFLVKRITGGIDLPGWTALTVISLFLGGVTLFFLGVIGEYVGRVTMNVNRVPQYSIREIVRASRFDG